MNNDECWESDSSLCSCHSAYDFNYDSDGDNTVASTMLRIFASGGKKKHKKKKRKGKATTPGPKMIMSSGVSKTPIRQQMESESFFEYEEGQIEEMPQNVAEKIVGTAVIKVMEGHFAKLDSKIDNLKTEVSTLKTIVARYLEENTKLCEIGRHAPDPEKRQTMMPRIPKNDLTIKARPQLQPHKWVGSTFAREILTGNLENQVERDNATTMIIDESGVEPG